MVWAEYMKRRSGWITELYSNNVVLGFYELDDHYEYYSHLLILYSYLFFFL